MKRLTSLLLSGALAFAVSGCGSLEGISDLWQPLYQNSNVHEVKIRDLSPEQQKTLKQRADALISCPYPKTEEALQIYGELGLFPEMDAIIKKSSLDIGEKNGDVVRYMGIRNFYWEKHQEKNQLQTETSSLPTGN